MATMAVLPSVADAEKPVEPQPPLKQRHASEPAVQVSHREAVAAAQQPGPETAISAPLVSTSPSPPSLAEDPEVSEELYWPDVQREATSVSKKGMELLRGGGLETALDMFNRASDLLADAMERCRPEELAEVSGARAAAAGNLALCHKMRGDLGSAVRQLESALLFYQEVGSDLRGLASCHLKLSACFSEASLLEEALQEAEAAVALCGQLIAHCEPADGTARSMEPPMSAAAPDDYAMLAVAYHKVAEAHEAMRSWGKATLAYTQAHEIVQRSLSSDHHLAKLLAESPRCPRRLNPPDVPTTIRGPARSSTPASGQTRGLSPFFPNAGGAAPLGQRRPLPPYVVKSWARGPKPPPGQVAGAAGRALLRSRGEPGDRTQRYRLTPRLFPSWPPRKVSQEEEYWYGLAREDRAQQQTKLRTELRGTGTTPPPLPPPLALFGHSDSQ